MEARSGFLHDGAGHCRNKHGESDFSTLKLHPRTVSRLPTDVFEGFALFDELSEAALHDAGRPFVHLVLAVVGATNDVLDALGPKQQIKE